MNSHFYRILNLMTPEHSSDTQAFLTITNWVEGGDRDLTAQALADAGLDYMSVRIRLGQAPPSIAAYCPVALANAALESLRSVGGEGLAPTLTDIERLGPTLKIKTMQIEDGNLHVELWQGPSTTIRREHVEFLIRAHVDRAAVRKHIEHLADSFGDFTDLAVPLAMGAPAWVIGSYAVAWIDAPPSPETELINRSHKLDIHTTDGTVYQVDGDKFGYRVLGAMRGYSDQTNMDQLCDLLAHLCPNHVVDPFFALWTPPAGHVRLRLPLMKYNNDDPAFAFYSRWSALMYRYLMK